MTEYYFGPTVTPTFPQDGAVNTPLVPHVTSDGELLVKLNAAGSVNLNADIIDLDMNALTGTSPNNASLYDIDSDLQDVDSAIDELKAVLQKLVDADIFASNDKAWSDMSQGVVAASSGDDTLVSAGTVGAGNEAVLLGIFGTLTADDATLTIKNTTGTSLTGAMTFQDNGGIVALDGLRLRAGGNGEGLVVTAGSGDFNGYAQWIVVPYVS